MANLHLALVNIAPERYAEFDATYAYFTIEYLDTPDWVCEVDPQKRIISLSRRVVEVVWSAAYAYTVFYIKEIQGKGLSSPREIDLHKDPEVNLGMQLLSWAYKNWFKNEDSPWPVDLPTPAPEPTKGSFLNVADELCLCSMAYVLHHELAHIRLGHDPNTSGPEQEREADYAAAEWIMHPSLQDYDAKFIKRALGISIALEVLTSQGIHTGYFGGRSHPPSYDRLIYTLGRFIHDDNHVVWAVVVAALKLHLDTSGRSVPPTEYKTFAECANDYANILAQNLENR